MKTYTIDVTYRVTAENDIDAIAHIQTYIEATANTRRHFDIGYSGILETGEVETGKSRGD